MSQSTDGGRKLPATDSERSSANPVDDPKLTLFAEELEVRRETVGTGRLRVSKQTRTREASVDESLLSEHADVETIPIGRQIFEMPKVRQEGDTIIVPIVEEVLHTERRLILKEEVRITRLRKTVLHPHETQIAPPPLAAHTYGTAPSYSAVYEHSDRVLADYLRGVSFSASKQELLRYARASNIGSNVVHMIDGLADRTYASVK